MLERARFAVEPGVVSGCGERSETVLTAYPFEKFLLRMGLR